MSERVHIENNGNFIKEKNNKSKTLSEKPAIKITFLEKGVWVKKPIRNSKGNLIKVEDVLTKVKPSTAKIINEKANQIDKEIERKYFQKIKNADEKNIENIIAERESELNAELDKLIQKEMKSQKNGRKEKSLKLSIENFQIYAVEETYKWFKEFDVYPSDLELAEKLNVSSATLYRRLADCEWTMESLRAKAKEKMKEN